MAPAPKINTPPPPPTIDQAQQMRDSATTMAARKGAAATFVSTPQGQATGGTATAMLTGGKQSLGQGG